MGHLTKDLIELLIDNQKEILNEIRGLINDSNLFKKKPERFLYSEQKNIYKEIWYGERTFNFKSVPMGTLVDGVRTWSEDDHNKYMREKPLERVALSVDWTDPESDSPGGITTLNVSFHHLVKEERRYIEIEKGFFSNSEKEIIKEYDVRKENECYLFSDENILPAITLYPTIYNILQFDDLANFINTNKSVQLHSEEKAFIVTLQNYVKSLFDKYSKLLVEEDTNIELELASFDKDNNGVLDLIESNDFMKLLSKHQPKIIEVDKDYIQKFIKLSNYIKTKQNNIQQLFESINNSNLDSKKDKRDLFGSLKNQIHTYELITLHSLNMVMALVENDLITFYEIFEVFDKLNVFNSNWENEVAQKLSNVDQGLTDLIYSIDKMEQNIVNEISNLSYITQTSFMSLESNLTKELQSIQSGIGLNNLLTGIQTYKMYQLTNNKK